MKFIKKYYKYFFIFLLAFLCNVVLRGCYYDSAVQYGMAHAVRIGEIPYVDFNMVSTPFYIFVCAIPLFIYDNFILFCLLNGLFVAIMYYFADQIIKYHKLTFLLFSLLPFLDVFAFSYNLLCKVFIVLLIYCEGNKKNEYLIGFLLGLLFLSKHTIGIVVLFFVFLYYFLNHVNVFKRLIGFVIPIVVFFIYLLITKSWYEFIDLCFLGLFNFGGHNSYHNGLLLVVTIISALFLMWNIFKDKTNIIPYYALGSLSFIIPICDYNHFASYFIIFLIFVFYKYDVKLNYIIFNIFLVILLISITVYNKMNFFHDVEFLNYPHFLGYAVYEEKNNIVQVLDQYQKYDNAVILSPNSMFYDVSLNHKVTYFDLPLRGNYGHKGTDKMIGYLKNDTYYFIDNLYSNAQFDQELCKYIVNRSTYIGEVGTFSIYYYNV